MTKNEVLVAEARIWARLDGCEGADFLNALCDALEMAHYTYALNGVEVEEPLTAIVRNEIEGHMKMATSPNAGLYGYDEEAVRDALLEIESLCRD